MEDFGNPVGLAASGKGFPSTGEEILVGAAMIGAMYVRRHLKRLPVDDPLRHDLEVLANPHLGLIARRAPEAA